MADEDNIQRSQSFDFLCYMVQRLHVLNPLKIKSSRVVILMSVDEGKKLS